MALIASVKRFARNPEFVDPEIRDKRRAKCRACDDRRGVFCSRCGCVLAIKTSWATEFCPINEWLATIKDGDRCDSC